MKAVEQLQDAHAHCLLIVRDRGAGRDRALEGDRLEQRQHRARGRIAAREGGEQEIEVLGDARLQIHEQGLDAHVVLIARGARDLLDRIVQRALRARAAGARGAVVTHRVEAIELHVAGNRKIRL